MPSPRKPLLMLAFAVAVVAPGCGGPDEVGATLPVSGTILVVDKPLESGTVTFHPDASKGNTTQHIAVGTVNVGDYKMAIGAKSGVLPGWNKVTVHATVPSNPKDEYSVPKSLINEKYAAADRTPLTAEVKEGGGPYDFKVTK